MRIFKIAALAAMTAAMTAPAWSDAWYAWSPKPDKLVPYGKNKPVTIAAGQSPNSARSSRSLSTSTVVQVASADAQTARTIATASSQR